MKYGLVILSLAIFTLSNQQDEIKLDAALEKITSVSAMRVRKAPQTTAEEVTRLKLGTVVNAVARSASQDTVAGKTDYWYRVNLPNGTTGWLFGGLLLDYDATRRNELMRQIIGARLKAENTDFADRQEIYNLAASSAKEAKDVNTRAEFELLKLLALANQAGTFPNNLADKSPYREWLKSHSAEVIQNEFAGGYNLSSEVLWNLETKYHSLPIAERIAWEAVENQEPSDCEGDEVCHLFGYEGAIKYLNLHPNGAHASEVLKNLTDLLTDEVINRANAQGGRDQYVIQERTDLRKMLVSLRTAVAKTSAPEKTELLKKLQKFRN
ncbi:MAG TPA: SH3 domain-containing protein [Pyrinomonadaceae bacterium]|nr:SH3 domain-containing protein [Pyrinomonadaceae bacterium]